MPTVYPLISIILAATALACQPTTLSEPHAYVIEVAGEPTIWAHGDAVLGPLDAPPVKSGVMLEKTTPGQSVDDATYELYRAIDGRLDPSQSHIQYVDLHAEDSSKVLAYNFNIEVRRQGAIADVYLVLFKESTYRNQQNAPVKLISVGFANFAGNPDRAMVTLEPNLKVGRIVQGAKQGHWALYHNAKAISTSQVSTDSLCRDATQLAGQINGQAVTNDLGLCKPRPSSMDFCDGDPTKADCIPPAPVGDAPFTDRGQVWDVNLEFIKERQYRFHLQAPVDATAEVVFVARTTDATSETNAELCKDQFQAKGWSIGGRINQACLLTPGVSPTPVDGKLACRVVVQISHAHNFQERVCYVKGIFTDEDQQVETVQFIKPHNKV